MEGGKSGHEKYYYFLLPNKFNNMWEVKMTGSKNNWMKRKQT